MRIKVQGSMLGFKDQMTRTTHDSARALNHDADEVGDLVASFPAGHVAKVDDGGALRIFRLSSDATTTADNEANMPTRLKAFNRRNRLHYSEAGK